MTYNYDPELAQMLEFLPEGAIDFSDVKSTRASFKEMTAALNAELDTTGVHVENREIPGPEGAPPVPVRLYTPENLEGQVPGLIHFHGGGFAVGDLDAEMGSCIGLCLSLGVVIVSVDYRLAPETPYPGGLEDCYAALLWTHDNHGLLRVDRERIALIGLSAGAGLSAATALLARDRNGPPLCFQYLGIPEVDDRLNTPSMVQYTDTPLWNRPNAELSWDFYLGESYTRGADDVPFYAAPARAQDLSGLPSAYVSTMEFDPLRDEGVLYAMKLMQAGVPCELHAFPGTFHGSSMFSHTEIAQREAAEMIAVLRRGLNIDN